MNKQRESVYSLRRELLEGKIKLEDEDEAVDTRAYLMTLAEDLVDGLVDTHAGKDANPEEWDLGALRRSVADLFGLEPKLVEDIKLESMSAAEMSEVLRKFVIERYDEKEKTGGIPSEILRRVERDVMLQIVDQQWKDHLYSLDHLKEGIGLRGYGQRDPLVEYKKESFELFQAMQGRVEEDMVRYLWRIRPVIQTGSEDAPPPPPAPVRQPPRRPQQLTMTGGSSSAASLPPPRAAASTSGVPGGAPKPARTGGDDALVKTVRRDEPKIGRNDPCWCGSGKKFKKCHGA
jgi:preprotein translocase subunit SecA